MFRTTHYAAAGCFLLGLAILSNPQTAQARRPSTIASKSYSSGKFVGKISTDMADDLIEPQGCDLPDVTLVNRPACQPAREPLTVNRPTTPVHVYKPLCASLPHATKQFPKIAATQFGR